MTKITIIMPVYNSEKYLDISIASVLSQSFRNFELLLIDDGSTDLSGEICDMHAQKDKRIRVIHQKNAGISGARNTGITHASGEYIGFIDDDDIFCKDLLQRIDLEIQKSNPDVIKFGYQVEESFCGDFVQKRINYSKDTFSFNKDMLGLVYEKLVAMGYFNMIWNGFYKRQFIMTEQIVFNRNVKAGYEDWIFNYQICMTNCKQVVLPGIGYIHYQRIIHSTSKKYNANQPEAILLAARYEKDMYDIINASGDIILSWPHNSIKYILEILFLFQRPGCNLSLAHKIDLLKKFHADSVFREVEAALDSKLSKKRKLIVKLFVFEYYRKLLFLAQIYGSVLFLKRRFQKVKESVR